MIRRLLSPPLLLLVGVALAALAACGGDDTEARREQPAASRSAPAIPVCERLAVRTTGVVDAPSTSELSGLVRSRDQHDVLWTHNDSGDSPRVFAISSRGRLRAEFTVAGAEAVDWEDIATGPSPGGRGALLYLADIGDNLSERASVTVYRVPEPRVAAGGGTTAPADALHLRYPDGPHDAETLLVDPRTGDLAIVTKELIGSSAAYVAAAPLAAGSTTTLRRAATVRFGLLGLATGGDVSHDGTFVAVRTYQRVYGWRRARGESLAALLRRRPCSSPTRLSDGQGEALALLPGGRGFLTVAEADPAPLRRYAPASRER